MDLLGDGQPRTHLDQIGCSHWRFDKIEAFNRLASSIFVRNAICRSAKRSYSAQPN
jgi:hypothetical protein